MRNGSAVLLISIGLMTSAVAVAQSADRSTDPGTSMDTTLGLMLQDPPVIPALIDSVPKPKPDSIPPDTIPRPKPDSLHKAQPKGKAKPHNPKMAKGTGLEWRGKGRPNPIKGLVQAAKGYAADMVYMYTAPIRMDATNALVVGGVLAAGSVAYAHDHEVLDAFERSRGNPVYDRALDAGNFFEPLGLISRTHRYYEAASVLGWVLDIPVLRTIPGELLESHSIAGGMRQPIEKVTGRLRPRDNEGPSVFKNKHGDSFPSGHASVVCEVASVVTYHYRNPVMQVLMWGIAGTACLQRVDSQGHWPSDVIVGAAFGTWAGHTVARRNDERRRGIDQGPWWDFTYRPTKTSAVSVMPVVDDGYIGLGARAAF